MKKTKKLILTVAIPTYNRKKTLERILNQLSKERNQSFQIIVSDNNSSDNTQDMVNRYQKTMRNLDYNKNEQNLGYSGNLTKLYELARTRYIWFLSDDEEIIPGAIDVILEALNKHKAVITLFNHVRTDPYGRELEDGVGSDVVYDDVHKLTDYTSLLRTCFISIIVVEKRLHSDIIKKVYDKNNVYFQLSLSLLLLSDKFKFCEIATPIVYRNTTYESGEFFKFLVTDWLDAIFIVKHNLNRERIMKWAKKEIFNTLQLYLCQKIGMYKYNGKPTKETIRKIVNYYGFSSILIFLFPVIYHLTPTFLLKYLYRKQLIRIHGEEQGVSIYNMNLNRALKTKSNSGFINYR